MQLQLQPKPAYLYALRTATGRLMSDEEIANLNDEDAVANAYALGADIEDDR